MNGARKHSCAGGSATGQVAASVLGHLTSVPLSLLLLVLSFASAPLARCQISLVGVSATNDGGYASAIAVAGRHEERPPVQSKALPICSGGAGDDVGAFDSGASSGRMAVCFWRSFPGPEGRCGRFSGWRQESRLAAEKHG
jgi:hypothetical protein